MPPSLPSITRSEGRFTLDGDPELEAHLADTSRRVTSAVRGLLGDALEALVLGGGYGRGEGGVLVTPEGQRPYNDLEFYVFVRSQRQLAEWRHGRALTVLGEILTPSAGAHLEFKLASRRELVRRPVSMFSYDLVTAHRRLHGPPDLFARCSHHQHAPRLPLFEATRLLMNRGSGLLLARERLERETFSAADADFVARNLAKAALALGDAVLTARQRYHWSCRERHRRLEHDLARGALPRWCGDLLPLHAAGVEFKLHPFRSTASAAELAARMAELSRRAEAVWLWVEEQRLHRHFASARHYALDPHPKIEPAGSPRELAARIWQNGAAGCLAGAPWRAPRERLLRALVLLLWDPDALRSPALLTRLQRELHTDAVALPAFVSAYQRLWARVA